MESAMCLNWFVQLGNGSRSLSALGQERFLVDIAIFQWMKNTRIETCPIVHLFSSHNLEGGRNAEVLLAFIII